MKMKHFRRLAGNLPGTPDKSPTTRAMNELNEQAQNIVNKRGLLLLPLLLLLTQPAVAQPQFTYTNSYGIWYYTTTNGNGAITIMGYNGHGGALPIPDRIPETTNGLQVTCIGDAAFAFSRSLTSVTIPNNVTNIGVVAFRDCTSLTSVTIGTNVTSIRDGAFTACTGLTNITIPNSVTSIGQDAFSDCYSLTNITIGSGVTASGTRRSLRAPT